MRFDKSLANEKVQLLFYLIIEKGDKRLLKPLKFEHEIAVSLKLVRAIADDTVIPTFYETLQKNLLERGVKPGSKVQMRAKFNEKHAMLDPVFTGTRVLCEVTV
jgi:hypothetical protein